MASLFATRRASALTTRSARSRRTRTSVPIKTDPLGVKGAGEAGNVGALAAIMNAVLDAIGPFGIAHLDMPATPEKVWRVIHAQGITK